MRYRLTCLTPVLVGDGSRLSPIDYMVWKDQVNVLDQRRIFRLLAKGPRLDNYLTQIKRADKLDFASWGGFAQNFAGRRIPFEHASYTAYWQRLRAEKLHIPTFNAGPDGPYFPGSAIKGALRTGLVFSRMSEQVLREVASQLQGDRVPRHPGQTAEDRTAGGAGQSYMKMFAVSDSAPVAIAALKIHLLRVATLEARGSDRYELGWKQAPRGTVDGRRPEDSTPLFAEMASPGTVFEGTWTEKSFYRLPEVARALRWKDVPSTQALLAAANAYAARLLENHKGYAARTGLSQLQSNIEGLEARLAEARERGDTCLLAIGWGCGFLGKAAYPETDQDAYRQILRQLPFYSKAVRTGMPFPKTRRIVFLENRPAILPGWVTFEIQ
jgi:CRISPR-associated protein Csm5